MTHGDTPDRNILIQRYHIQLYQFALLVTGDRRTAEQLVQHAYTTLPETTDDPEAALIHSLMPHRNWHLFGILRTRWPKVNNTARDAASTDAIFATLAHYTPLTRYIIGLHYLRGWSVDEITPLIGNANAPSPAMVLSRFRLDVADVLNLVPHDVDEAALLRIDTWLDGQLTPTEAVEVRRELLDDPTMCSQRDRLTEVRELLLRVLPGMFATSPPPAFTERLFDLVKPPPQPRETLRPTRAHVSLTVGVLALAALIILGPSLAARRSVATSEVNYTAPEILEQAIHRFDQTSLEVGVLHERYRVQVGDRPAYLIERWYDYAPPHRLMFTIRDADKDNTAPVAAISSDGRNQVQYRYNSSGPNPTPQGIDVSISPDEAQAALPVLRNLFSPTVLSSNLSKGQFDISPLYLTQARATGAAALGQTTFLGRPAYLLTYDTNQLPTLLPGSRNPTTQKQKVLLTIDAQTNALLDVAVFADGTVESSAQHPLQAELLDVTSNVPDTQFTLPNQDYVTHRNGILSVNMPTVSTSELLTLEDATRVAGGALLVPQQLPDTQMRGLALYNSRRGNNRNPALLYEGEFQTILLTPQLFARARDASDDEQSIGDLRYHIVRYPFGRSNQQIQNFSLAAEVYRQETPDQRLLALIVDAYSTDAERQAKLKQLVASLTPVTPQNLSALQRNFRMSTADGG